MATDGWFLSPEERGNPATVLDCRHTDPAGGPVAYTVGNQVTPLVHGARYFAALLAAILPMRRGDLLLFTDWRGDPDERLAGEGTEVGRVLAAAAARGVVVKGLIWRSHLDRLQFSATENRHLGDEINAAGGECLLDMRVRAGGSHHQKFVVLRHPGRPELDVAFVGGIDLCHSRHDDADHRGDPQEQPIAKVYGARAPWHDIQSEIRGPAVGDVETVFRERWTDPSPLSRNPVQLVQERVRREDHTVGPLPVQLPDPVRRGLHRVQLLRTYPYRRGTGYPFAPAGERSVARGYGKALRRARRLVYVEDQYLWSSEVAQTFTDSLRASPGLRVIVVLPRFPDQDGRLSEPPNLVGRIRALGAMTAAGPGRVAVYGLENHDGVPVYVHAKACVIDDVWAAVGSDNFNRRSWSHDSELTCAVLDDTRDDREPRDPAGLGDGARRYARDLRLELAREHLDRDAGDDADLLDPVGAFEAFGTAAARLDAWHADGRQGPRPAGRLRSYPLPVQSAWTTRWSTPLYHRIYDPDGRPAAMRRQRRF